MTTKHTNGKWIAHTDSAVEGITVEIENGRQFYISTDGEEYQEVADRARLIAASPALLQSAESFLAWFRVFIGEEAFAEIRCDELDNLQDAIKAAKGE